MQLVGRGNARALEVIFDRHGSAAFSLAYRMCGRRVAAEDIVQEAFMSLWRTAGRYDPRRGSVRAWLLNVVRNKAVDAFRRETAGGGRDLMDDQAAAQVPAPDCIESEVELREYAARVRTALIALPDEQRQVIELAFFGGFTHREISGMLGLPTGTVKGRMRLGLAKMRTALGGSSPVLTRDEAR